MALMTVSFLGQINLTSFRCQISSEFSKGRKDRNPVKRGYGNATLTESGFN